MITPNLYVKCNRAQSCVADHTHVGDICSAECKTQNGLIICMVVVYITPNSSIEDIIKFIHLTLLHYTAEGLKILGIDLYKIPMILALI